MRPKLHYARKALSKVKRKPTNTALEQLAKQKWPPELPPISSSLATQVFTHKSHVFDPRALDHELIHLHNDRLEFLGDSVLNIVSTNLLLEKFPYAESGRLSELKSSLICNKTLAEYGQVYNILSKLQAASPHSDLLAAQTMEAYVGAAYLHNGINPVNAWFDKLTNPLVHPLQEEEQKADPLNRNAKSELYALIKFAPQYNIIRMDKGDGIFEVDCCIRGSVVATGQGYSINEAGIRAAMAALQNPDVLRLAGGQ